MVYSFEPTAIYTPKCHLLRLSNINFSITKIKPPFTEVKVKLQNQATKKFTIQKVHHKVKRRSYYKKPTKAFTIFQKNLKLTDLEVPNRKEIKILF